MTEPDRVDQTINALVGMELQVQSNLAHRRNPEDGEWRAKTLIFRKFLILRLREAKKIAKQHRIAQSKIQTSREGYEFRDLLAVLVEAVFDHHQTVVREYEPTTADNLLWMRMNLLTLPGGNPILELIKRSKIKIESAEDQRREG
jgi:hypothetical protein